MKRPLHVLIVGLAIVAWAAFSMVKAEGQVDGGIVQLYALPLLIYGLLLVASFIFYPVLKGRLPAAALYATCFGVSIVICVLWLIAALAA